MILDKHPGYCYHLPLIERLLPGFKVIHAIRDGREVAVSMLSANERIGFGSDSMVACAREWSESIALAREHGRSVGVERYAEVRYEEIIGDTQAKVAELFAFCGLPTDAAFCQEVAAKNHISAKPVSHGDPAFHADRGKKGSTWLARTTLVDRYLFDRVAGETLLGLGYAGKGWWASGPMDRLRMSAYPLRVKIMESLRSLLRIWSRPVARRART